MLGSRLSPSALTSPLRHGRKLPRSPRATRAVPWRSAHATYPQCGVVQSTPTAPLSESSAAAAGVASRPRAGGRGKRARQVAAAGLPAVLGAVAVLLAKEDQPLPESLGEWDDNLVWEEVHELAQLSNMTNRAPQLIAKWFDCHAYEGGLIVRDLPEVSARYFVHAGYRPGEEHRRVHHVAIRGTVSLDSLSYDLKTRLVFDEECGCVFHMGFKEVADAVADDIEQFLEPGAEIKIAGHSLGGSVAVILAAKLKARGHNVGKVMTFGAPMVTDTRGADLLRGSLPVMRVTHERDPVPLAPFTMAKPSSLPLGGRDQDGRAQRRLPSEAAATGVASAGVDATGSSPGKGDSQSLDGVFREKEGEGGVRTRDAAGWGIGPSSAYSHFGSQLVLLRRKECIECRREEASGSPQPSQEVRLQRRRTTAVGTWDDIWGPPPGSTDASSSDEAPSDGSQRCEHCPSRGTTYYDPKGDDGCFFDSAWLRLANVSFTHRMNHYEEEVANRLAHHLLRDRAKDASPLPPPSPSPSPQPHAEEKEALARTARPEEASQAAAAVC